MGIFSTVISTSKNNILKSSSPSEKSRLIELNMSTKQGLVDEREEGEIIDEFEDIISSDEEFSMRKRIEELEAKNAELEKIANISVSAVYSSGAYDFPKKDLHQNDRYPLESIDISDDEEYPPAPKMPSISKRRKSLQHSSCRHKLLHTSSSSHRRRKRSSSPPPAPQYRQSDKLLLSLFHERVVSHNSHSSKRRRKSKKTHSTRTSRRSREYYVSDTDDEYSHMEAVNVNYDSQEKFVSSDGGKSFSLNRDELRVALARNTQRYEQYASLKDRLTRKKENRDIFNIENAEDSQPQQLAALEKEEKQQVVKAKSPLEEKAESESDNMEEQELRILALKSAVLKKHMVRKKRNENVAYSPSDFDEIYKCINESPALNNIDDTEACNSMEISPVPSPKMVLSDDGGIDTKPVDMDIVNSDSDYDLPAYDNWMPIEQIPLPNSIGMGEEIYNPTPIRFDNNHEDKILHSDVRYGSASVSPKNFDSEVDEEEFALRTLLLAKMNSPKVNKIARVHPPKVIKVQTPDPDVSLEAEELRNFLINNMKKKTAKSNDLSASVLKEAVRRLTGRNASASPNHIPNESSCRSKTADETEKQLGQAIKDMANVKIGLGVDSKAGVLEPRNNSPFSGVIRVKNIETLSAAQSPVPDILKKINLGVHTASANFKNVVKQENENSKEILITISQKDDNIKKITLKESIPGKPKTKGITNDVLKSFDRKLCVKIEKMIFPSMPINQDQEVRINLNEKASTGTSLKTDSEQTPKNVIVDVKEERLGGIQLNTNVDLKSKSEKETTLKVVAEKEIPKMVPKSGEKTLTFKEGASNQTLETATEKQFSTNEILDDMDMDSKKDTENLKEIFPNKSSIVQSKNIEVIPSGKNNVSHVMDSGQEVENLPKDLVHNKDQYSILSKETLIHEVMQDVHTKETLAKNIVENNSLKEKEGFSTKNKIECIPNEENLTITNKATKLHEEILDPNKVLHMDGSLNLEENLKSDSEAVVSTDVLEVVEPQKNSSFVKPSTNEDSELAKESCSASELVSKIKPTNSLADVDQIKILKTVSSSSSVLEKLEIQSCKDEDSEHTSITIVVHNEHSKEENSNVERCTKEPGSLEILTNTTETTSNITSSKSEMQSIKLGSQGKQIIAEPLTNSAKSTKTISHTKTLQIKTNPVPTVRTKTVNIEKHIPQKTEKVSKIIPSEKLTEKALIKVEKLDKPVIKNTLSTPKKILPSAASVISQKPIVKLPTQQALANRTKIVKPNKVINQQTIDLKRKPIDNTTPSSIPTKKPKIDETNRLITTAEIPQVSELVIQLRASESESEYSELSAEDMEEDEESRVRNFFNRSITIGNEYYDIASPISLPMESPCDTPTQVGSPVVSRTQTPQPSVEKSIVNDYFEAKLEQFLKNVRSKVTDNTVKSVEFEGHEIGPVISTPVAVRHLPEASQQEYRRLINRMKMLERQKQAKNVQVVIKTSDAGAVDTRSNITDSGSKFLVRKVLVKNATSKSPPSITQKPKPSVKTETIVEASSSLIKSVESLQKTAPSQSIDTEIAKKPTEENLLILYENSYRKTGASIIANLNKSIELVNVAKQAKMAKLKHEKRLKELRKEIEEVQSKLKEQQEKITKIYPEICNSHRAIESLKARRTKINKAVTALGKTVVGPNYSMENDQKSIISETSKKLAGEIKFVNNMKIGDVEKLEIVNVISTSDNAISTVAPPQNIKRPLKEQLQISSNSVAPPSNFKTLIEVQKASIVEQLPAYKNDIQPSNPSSSSSKTPNKNEVPNCDNEIPEIVNAPVLEVTKDVETYVNDTIVPETPKLNQDVQKDSFTINGHEEALEIEQPLLVGDDDNNEQAEEQTDMEGNSKEEQNGEQVGSTKLQDYVSPLNYMRDERQINPNGVVCPYQLMGQCDDKDCKYMHLEDEAK